MKIHKLKTWPQEFRDMIIGIKRFDVRMNDRDFKKGDILIACEYDHPQNKYSGEASGFIVSYIMYGGQFGVHSDFCVMSIDRCDNDIISIEIQKFKKGRNKNGTTK